jgi:hypothetical protein
MKSKIIKTFGVYRFRNAGKLTEEYYRGPRLELMEVLKLEDRFDTEEEAIEYITNLNDWTNTTILPIYGRVPDYD